MRLELIIVAILLCMSALFSASETAITSFSRSKLRSLKRRKSPKVKALIYLKENPGIMLATILIGNNIVNIAIASLATLITLDTLHKFNILNEAYITPLTTLFTTIILLVFGEVTPKTLALSANQKFAILISPFIKILSYVFKPLVYILNKFSNFCLRLLGGHHLEKDSLVTEEEILNIIEAGQESGSIARDEKTMLHDVIRFGDTLVGEVMTHIDNIISVDENFSVAQVMETIKGRIHSRLPVYCQQKTNICGILYLKDLLLKLPQITDPQAYILKSHPEIIRKPLIVYIDQKTAEILKELRYHKVHIAVVKNRDGKTVGLVTIEDMIEEIIGEIRDEHEPHQ